jgi:hypothetical protein
MVVSSRCNSLWLCALVVLGACEQELPPLEGTTSLRVEVMQPKNLGAADKRLAATDTEVTLRVTAFDVHGEFDPTLSAKLPVFVHYQGSRLWPKNLETQPNQPARIRMSEDPIATVDMQNGETGPVTLTLPTVYGATLIWVDDTVATLDRKPTFAIGASDTLWYPDPTVAALSAPFDEKSPNAFEAGQLHGKQVVIDRSRYGARGRLVVTGAYSDGFTLSDVECADDNGTPPCVAHDYDHVFVFSYSEGRYEEGGGSVEVGQTISRFGGSVTEFNGLLEISFPQVYAGDLTARPELVPEPALFSEAWLDDPVLLERQEAGLLRVENGKICPTDDAFTRFGQWKLDVGRGCATKAISVVTKGVVPFDPNAHVGETVPSVVGTLRPVNIGSFNVWILYPRGSEDVSL